MDALSGMIGVERVPGGREGMDAGTSGGPDGDGCINSSGTGDKGVGDEKGDQGGGCGEHGDESGRVAGSRGYPSVSSSSNSFSLATASTMRRSKSKLTGLSGIITRSAVPGAHGENVLPERVCNPR